MKENQKEKNNKLGQGNINEMFLEYGLDLQRETAP